MRRRLRLTKCLFLLACLQAQLPLVAAEDTLIAGGTDLLRQLQNYQALLEDLESEFGPYHISLLEPLDSMEELWLEQGDFQRVAELQNRQLQVIRTVLGLQHPDLVPRLRAIITNQMRLGNWERISDHLLHIRNLLSSDTDVARQDVLQAIDDQAYWHLSRVYLDKPRQRARNLMAARELFDEMERLAEDSFGEDSPQMIPWLYKQAVNKYQLVEFLNASGGLGSDTMRRLIREDGMAKLQLYAPRSFFPWDTSFIPIIDGDKPIGEAYLREGLNLVVRIRSIAEAQGDLEAEAMAIIYHGDFQLLMDQGRGLRKYREAREKLQSAGILETRIEEFFNQPTPIPVDRYFSKLEDAIAYQRSSLNQIGPIASEIVHLGVFSAWNESVPATQLPVQDDPFWNLNLSYNQIDLKFSISSRGGASSTKVIGSVPDEKSVRSEARRAVRDMQFRPAIFAGRSRRVRDVQIRYLFLVE